MVKDTHGFAILSANVSYTLDIVTSLLFFTQIACYDRITKKLALAKHRSVTKRLPKNWSLSSTPLNTMSATSDGYHTARSSSTSSSSLSRSKGFWRHLRCSLAMFPCGRAALMSSIGVCSYPCMLRIWSASSRPCIPGRQ